MAAKADRDGLAGLLDGGLRVAMRAARQAR